MWNYHNLGPSVSVLCINTEYDGKKHQGYSDAFRGFVYYSSDNAGRGNIKLLDQSFI